MTSLARLLQGASSKESATSDSAWSLLGIGLVIGGSSALLGYYVGKRRANHKQKEKDASEKWLREAVSELHKRQTVVPGDFRELNEKIIALVEDEVCSLTGELSGLLRKKEHSKASRRMQCTWWKEQGAGPHVKHGSLFDEVDLEVWNGKIRELGRKIILLQTYLTPAHRSLLSTDPENAPEIFCCPITFDIMKKPVIAADGYTYDEESIRMWLNTSRVSPKTNQEMHSTLLLPNNALRLAIKGWREEMRLRSEDNPCKAMTIRSRTNQAGRCDQQVHLGCH